GQYFAQCEARSAQSTSTISSPQFHFLNIHGPLQPNSSISFLEGLAMLLSRIFDTKRFLIPGLLLLGGLIGFTRAVEASPMMIEIDATPTSGGATIPYYLDYSDGPYTTQVNGNSTWWGEEDVSPQVHVKWHLDVDLDPGISGPITITNNFGVP